MTDTLTSLRRRHLLAGSAGALAAAGLGSWTTGASAQTKPLPPYAAWKDADSVIVHSSSTIETRRSAFGSSGITPTNRLYVRNNLPAPDAAIVANPTLWEIAIEGVKHPRTLQVAQLKSLGLETVTMVLQCSGNGRGYFPQQAERHAVDRSAPPAA